MDAPIPNIPRRHMESPSAGGRATPPASTTSPQQNMVLGPHHSFAIAPAGRPPGLPAQLPPIGLRSPVGFNASQHHYLYTTASTSPSATSGSLQETQPHDMSSLSAPGLSPTQISSSSLSAQKRAYRQRRKDPSCDACRERKVKCDATETTACSECSSRNHKCQFTKETNRRMSSIKQVQDLQSRVAELTQENSQLRTGKLSEINRDAGTGQHQNGQILSSNTLQKPPIPVMRNFDPVRANVRKHSRGVFDLPFQYQHSILPTNGASSFPDMPPRGDFAHLSRSYLDSIQDLFPILHWPTFQHEVDQVYTARSFQGKSREWIGLFFAVMACGALHTTSVPAGFSKCQDRGSIYFGIATQAMDPTPLDVTIIHASLAFLLSIFATESNLKPAGAVWLASAVRLAQCIGLHSESNAPVVEGEMRRRLWWSIYVWDRTSSLGTNLPMLINDDDCSVSMPSSLEDRYIQPQGFTRAAATQPPFTGFLAVIQAARVYPHVCRALKSGPTTPQTLQSLDEKFHSTMMLFPEPYLLSFDAPLEPAALTPIIALLTARFILYRRNLSPICRLEERTQAIRRCTVVAHDTAKYISRTLHTSAGGPAPDGWRTKATQLASNMICTHLWRCLLMLCFSAEYEAALACLRLSSAIGDLHKINVACGKNLAFFLERLSDRIRSGIGAHWQLDDDEEMIAYMSGDLQGNPEHSWVWAGGEDHSSPLSPPPTGVHSPHGSDVQMQGTMNDAKLPLRSTSGMSENGTAEWDGWGRIEHTIHQLMDERRARRHQPIQQPMPSPYYPAPHNPLKRVQLAPDAPASPTRMGPGPTPTTSSSSRISIANII